MKWLANRQGSWAMLQHARRKTEKALKTYQRAYKAGMNAPVALSAYGLLLSQNGRAEEAIPVIERALQGKRKLKPRDLDRLSTNLSLAYWKSGDIDAAVRTMKEQHARTPTAGSYGTLGYFLIEQGDKTGDYDEALAFNKEATEYDDTDAVILDNLAQVYVRRKEYREAIPYLRKALEKRPGQVDSLYYLALSQMETGDRAAARESLQKALGMEFRAMSTVTRAQAEALYERVKDDGGV